MPTSSEKKALWFLALVALSGGAVRLWRASVPAASAGDAVALDAQIARVDSVRAAREDRPRSRVAGGRGAHRARDSAHAEPVAPVDLDRASAEEIERLPGIGPALAQRIVAARATGGEFGDIAALCEVSGIGPALIEKLRPLVTFTGPRRPLNVGCSEAGKRSRATRGARVPERR